MWEIQNVGCAFMCSSISQHKVFAGDWDHLVQIQRLLSLLATITSYLFIYLK